LQPIYNDLFTPFEAGADNALATEFGSKLNMPIRDGVRLGQSQHELLRLVCADRTLFYKERGVAVAQRDSDSREQARNDASVRIRKDCAQESAASVGIEMVVERLDITLVFEACFVSKLELDRNSSVAISFQFLCPGKLVELEKRVFVDIRINVNRVD